MYNLINLSFQNNEEFYLLYLKYSNFIRPEKENLERLIAENALEEKVKLVITDIEMPQMDGHRLTKLIKDSAAFSHIPVVIFSSLVNDEMRKKGEALGADAQLSKPEIGNLVAEIDKILWK